MAISLVEFPKRVIYALRELPRDIFGSREGIAPAALPAVTVIDMSIDWNGWGLDLDITNGAAALGPCIVTIDKSKVVTLPAGTRFTLENVLFSRIEFRRGVAGGAPAVNAYFAGISNWVIENAR